MIARTIGEGEAAMPPAPPGLLARLRMSRPRDVLLQGLVVVALAAFIALVTTNLIANVARLHIHLGFQFLGRPAGFGIAQTPIPYPADATYFRAFLIALINTVLIGVVAIVASTVLGFFVAIARLSDNPLLSFLGQAYIETVRNVPLLLQLFFWYFSVLGSLPAPRQSYRLFGLIFLNERGLSMPFPHARPDFLPVAAAIVALLLAAGWCFRAARRHRVRTGQASRSRWTAGLSLLAAPVAVIAIFGSPVAWDVPVLEGFNLGGGLAIIPEFVALAIGMSIYGSAFVAELIRGGVVTVGRGQREAGAALGLSRWRVFTRVVFPQAMRAIVPPLTGQYIILLKNTSLASAIGYPDLMLVFAGTTLNQTEQPLEVMLMTMTSYLALCLTIAYLGNLANRRFRLVER